MLRIWRCRLPEVLRDYVRQNGIRRTFGAFSSGYGAVVPSDLTDEDWRVIAHFGPRSDSGAALQAVPRKVGEALVAFAPFGVPPVQPLAALWNRPTSEIAAPSPTLASPTSG